MVYAPKSPESDPSPPASVVPASGEQPEPSFHDRLVQRLFAAGMGLRAVIRVADPAVTEQLEQIVDELDHAINQVRTDAFSEMIARAAPPLS